MATDQLADEVAEDFRASLADLTTNDRYQINNFTVIARENTEYASEISTALVEHIAKAKPAHKLPALYVLDSIAKNIGSPYTLFLGYRLYTTFMNAYTSVDKPTRRKLDEMLKTWQMPVPNSLDPRPVFPQEITGKMVNALQQSTARATQFEQQQRNEQEMLRRRWGPGGTPSAAAATSTGWRDTPTPPQASVKYPAPLPQGYANGQGYSQYPPTDQYQQALPQQQYPPNFMQQYPAQANSAVLDSLHYDIENLIKRVKEDLILNLNSKEIQIKLKALLDLQEVLRSQQLAPAALQDVRDQVRALQLIQTPRPLPTQGAALPLPVPAALPPTPIALQTTPYSTATPMQYVPPPPLPPQTAPPLASTNLADLLASMQKSSTPALPMQISTPQLPTSLLATASVAPPSAISAENPLFAQLRAAGLLPSTTPPLTNSASVAKPPPAPAGPINLADLLKSVAPKVSAAAAATAAAGPKIEKIELTSASLKIPRPHLISRIYQDRPNQCGSCGKRFLATDKGKAEKAKHLDWHFRTNQRFTESAQRGLSRSWYVDELEWGNFRDAGDEVGYGSSEHLENPLLLGPNSRKEDPRSKFVLVPSDKALANAPCPICQEKFEVTRNEDVQDWVWMDAIKVGGRIFHASCYAEMRKDGDVTPARTATPDSVLGKRKAEGSANPSPSKIFRESMD